MNKTSQRNPLMDATPLTHPKRWAWLAFGLAVVTAAPQAALAETCFDDYWTWTWLQADPATNSDPSMDGELTAQWCGNAELRNGYHEVLNLGSGIGTNWDSAEVDWAPIVPDNLGTCSPNAYFPRLINAARALDLVRAHRATTTLPPPTHTPIDWIDYVASGSYCGYAYRCTTVGAEIILSATTGQAISGVIASHPPHGTLFHAPFNLYYWFFWLNNAFERAGVLVHENTHHTIGHIAPWSCPNRCGQSCDLAFGQFNAQTLDLWFLDDAIAAHRMKPGTTELEIANFGKVGTANKRICGYIPLLSPQAREKARDTAFWKLTNCFSQPVTFFPDTAQLGGAAAGSMWNYGGTTNLYDMMHSTRWECGDICPNCGSVCDAAVLATGCNEDYQYDNRYINDDNVFLCDWLNSQVYPDMLTTEWTALQNQYAAQKKACIPGYSSEYSMEQCSLAQIEASDAGDIKNHWTLPSQPGVFDSDRALYSCIGNYCSFPLGESDITAARAACYEIEDMSRGCMETLCGSLQGIANQFGVTSREYFQTVQCRREFVESRGGGAEYYNPAGTSGECNPWYTECVDNKVREHWATARSLGQCTLVEHDDLNRDVSSAKGRYRFDALAAVATTSLESFFNDYPDVELDECMAYWTACDRTVRLQTGTLAKLADMVIVPPPAPRDPGDPGDPTYKWETPEDWSANDIMYNTHIAIGVATGAVDYAGAYTREQALDALITVPEANHALVRRVGLATYVAALGVNERRIEVFGTRALSVIDQAEVPARSGQSEAEAALRAVLAHGKTVRERVTSSTAQGVFQNAAASLTAPEYFDLLQGIATASTMQDVDTAYTAVEAAVQ